MKFTTTREGRYEAMSDEYDRRRYRELDELEKELIKERDSLAQKMKELLHAEGMTDRKRRLAQKIR